MRDTVDILGVEVDRGDMSEALERSIGLIDDGGTVFTPNPEIIMEAHRDKAFRDILNSADMVVPDGIGVVIASKILRRPVRERVAGYDLTCNILSFCAQKDIPVYIFGGKPGVAKKAGDAAAEKFGVRVCGTQHGYNKDDAVVINDICEKKPGFLMVCLGAPRQEKWIFNNKNRLPRCLMIGAGGSVDVLSGDTKRAPEIFIKLNLEWLHRLLSQPSRFVRMLDLPRFIFTVLFTGKRQREA